MDLAALGAVGAAETRGIDISQLYWKIGHSASGTGGKRYIFRNPLVYKDLRGQRGPITSRHALAARRACDPQADQYLNANEMITPPYSEVFAVVDYTT